MLGLERTSSSPATSRRRSSSANVCDLPVNLSCKATCGHNCGFSTTSEALASMLERSRLPWECRTGKLSSDSDSESETSHRFAKPGQPAWKRPDHLADPPLSMVALLPPAGVGLQAPHVALWPSRTRLAAGPDHVVPPHAAGAQHCPPRSPWVSGSWDSERHHAPAALSGSPPLPASDPVRRRPRQPWPPGWVRQPRFVVARPPCLLLRWPPRNGRRGPRSKTAPVLVRRRPCHSRTSCPLPHRMSMDLPRGPRPDNWRRDHGYSWWARGRV